MDCDAEMKDFGYSVTVFLPQRRSPDVVGRKLNGNGVVLRAKYFLPGIGIATTIICNRLGTTIVEKHIGRSLLWKIQHPDNVEMIIPDVSKIMRRVITLHNAKKLS